MELHDHDLAGMGMDTVSMRRLQRALCGLPVYQWPASEVPRASFFDTATSTCTSPFDPCEYGRMCDASRKAEMESIDKLNEVIESAVEGISDIQAMALIAKNRLHLLVPA